WRAAWAGRSLSRSTALLIRARPPPRSTLFPYTTLFRSLIRYTAETRHTLRRDTRRLAFMLARVRAVLALLVLVTLPLGCARPTSADQTRLWQKAPAAAAAPELTRFNDLLADLADRLKPALVHVRVRRAGSAPKDDDGPGEPRRPTGSAFIIESSGLIVTNAHVIEQP